MEPWMHRSLSFFSITIFRSANDKMPLCDISGKGMEWHEYLSVRVPTEFDFANSDISDIWRKMFEEDQVQFSEDVEFLECIVKWGDTMLMRWKYHVKIQITY